MGGRSGQSINSGSKGSGLLGKSGQLKEIQKLQKQKKELERTVEDLQDDLAKKNQAVLDASKAIGKGGTYEDYQQALKEKEEIKNKLKEAKENLERTDERIAATKGTEGNEWTSDDIDPNGSFGGDFKGKLNTEAQTDYKIPKKELEYLKDNKNPKEINGVWKSQYYHTTDYWKQQWETERAFLVSGLPKTEENYAVLYYTSDSKVNSGYYDGQTPTEQDKIYTEHLNKALDKYGNKFNGTTYRGVKDEYAKNLWNQVQNQGVGSEIKFDGFQSSAYTEKKAFGGEVIIVAKSKQGHMLDQFSHYPTEKEVLYKAGSKFKITGWEEKNGKKYIYLED